MASTINAKNTSTGVVITPDASGQLELQTADVTRMTIDVNGNVGVGTASPTAYGAGYTTLDVNGSTQGTIQCRANGIIQSLLYGSTTEGGTGTLTNIPFRFVTNNTERMRITSNGGVSFGSSSTNFGTSGQVLQSNGDAAPSWVNASAFAAGTRLAFQQTSAPTGWTKDTTAALNDSIMRIVTGTASSGGSTAFSTFNGQTATGATTLAESQIPSHTHNSATTTAASGTSGSGLGNTLARQGTSGATGGGGSHTHSMTTAIKYYDFIIASKD